MQSFLLSQTAWFRVTKIFLKLLKKRNYTLSIQQPYIVKQVQKTYENDPAHLARDWTIKDCTGQTILSVVSHRGPFQACS